MLSFPTARALAPTLAIAPPSLTPAKAHAHSLPTRPPLICSFPAELLDAEGAYRRVVVAGGSLARDVPVAVLTPRTPPPGLPGYLLTHANAGRQLVAPLTRRDGTRVLLLAGFVPSDVALPAGHVLPTALLAPAASGSPRPLAGLLQGVVRRSETPGQWGAVNSPGSGGMQGGELAGGRPFSFIDVPALAAACGLNASCGDVTDVLIEVVAPFPPAPVAGGAKDAAAQAATWPVTRQAPQFTSLITPSTHLIYAATWLTLATVGAVLTRQRFKPTRGAQRKMAMPSRRGRD